MTGLFANFVNLLPKVSYVSVIISFFCALFGYFLYARSKRHPDNLPPGPFVLPVVGNLFTMVTKDMDKTLADLRKRYGDIYRLYIGRELVIVLNGYEVIHDALVKHGSIFADRPISPFHKVILDNPVLLTCSGQTWKEHRSFSQQTLKHICLDNGAQRLQCILDEEVEYFLKEIETVLESDIDIVNFINVYSLNVIFRIIYGYRFTYDDPDGRYMTEAYNDLGMEYARLQVTANCFEFLLKLPGDMLNVKGFIEMRRKITALLHTFNESPNHNYEGNSYRLCDAYQTEIDKNQSRSDDDGRTDFPSFSEERLDNVCSELVAAASDTTANAIAWIVLYLVRSPSIQERMYEEILETLGESELPSFDDKNNMPYVEAVILESLRISSSVPYAVPHSVSKTINFQDYTVPKGCTVLVNLRSISKDPETFENPLEFRPDRFLSDDNKEVIVPKQCVSFSLGPRACIGVSIAMKEMFHITTALVKKYRLLPSGSMPDTTGVLSTVYKPQPFRVKVEKR